MLLPLQTGVGHSNPSCVTPACCVLSLGEFGWKRVGTRSAALVSAESSDNATSAKARQVADVYHVTTART